MPPIARHIRDNPPAATEVDQLTFVPAKLFLPIKKYFRSQRVFLNITKGSSRTVPVPGRYHCTSLTLISADLTN